MDQNCKDWLNLLLNLYDGLGGYRSGGSYCLRHQKQATSIEKVVKQILAQMIEESIIQPHPTACTALANNLDARKWKTCLRTLAHMVKAGSQVSTLA